MNQYDEPWTYARLVEEVNGAGVVGGIRKEAQQQDEYKADVELTGILETATTATGSLVFYVRDPLINQRTECDVSDRDIFNKALEAMQHYEKPRVAVYGKTTYVNGRPFRMRVERLEVWPSLKEHPGFFAVQGIDITGGMDAGDYLRSIRGGDYPPLPLRDEARRRLAQGAIHSTAKAREERS